MIQFAHGDLARKFKESPPLLQFVANTFAIYSLSAGIRPTLINLSKNEIEFEDEFYSLDQKKWIRRYHDVDAIAITRWMNEAFKRKNGLPICYHHAFLDRINEIEPVPYRFEVAIPQAWLDNQKKYLRRFMNEK